MPKPATWKDDPACGHDVACAFQTHYCTYERVPRLLTLQRPEASDELLLITAYQWAELWFKVLLIDLRAVLVDDGTTYEPVKLLKRGIELFKLFDLQFDFAETVIVREARLKKSVRDGLAISHQFAELSSLASKLARLERITYPDFAETMQEYAVRFKAFRKRFQRFIKATLMSEKSAAKKYDEWLCLSELLSLQSGVKAAWHEADKLPHALMSSDHIGPDENMFVIVHQCFELWFKVILKQLDDAISALMNGDVALATKYIRRVALLQRWLVQQIQMPATMLPQDFLKFRSQTLEKDGTLYQSGLSPASGTESYQFREIELLCGLRDDPAFQEFLRGSEKLPVRLLTPRQEERLKQATLPEAFRYVAQQRGIERIDDVFTAANAPNPHADLARLADLLLEFDESFHFWRLSHVSMVEKMIGARSGTGFLGPQYLMETTGLKVQKHDRVFEEEQMRPRFFKELWAVRSRLELREGE